MGETIGSTGVGTPTVMAEAADAVTDKDGGPDLGQAIGRKILSLPPGTMLTVPYAGSETPLTEIERRQPVHEFWANIPA